MARPDLHAAYYGGRGFTLFHASGPHASRPLTPHFHDEYLICAQLAGHEECVVAGKQLTFEPGDVVLINPQQVHTGNARGSHEVDYITLYVDRTVVTGLAAELSVDRAPEFTAICARGERELVAAIRALLGLVQEPGTPRAAEVESALLRVVSAAFSGFSNLRDPMRRSTSRVAHRKIAQALAHIRGLGPGVDPRALTLDALAEIAGLSKFHFLREFARVVGMTPGAYLRMLRLCHAARELRSTRRPIVEVALAAGFADHPSFSRAFARHMGLTPRQYQALGPI